MPRIHVCSLSLVEETVRTTGARSLVSLIANPYRLNRPASISADRHLFVRVSDIVEAIDGHTLPDGSHVQTLIDFVRQWDRREPIVIHCYAGVSRSTAAAFITACALHPTRPEAEIANAIRAASPTASPNKLLVEHADATLARHGRMIEAVNGIGQGTECLEGIPFALELA